MSTQLLTGPAAPSKEAPFDYRPAIVVGLVILVIAFGSLAVWSAVAPLARGAVAGGMVVVDTNRKEIQHLEGGIIAEILVRDGDRVAPGDVLVRLDPTNPASTRNVLQVQYLAALALQARLIAERRGADAIAFAPELLDEANPFARDLMANQKELFLARRNALEGQTDILERRIAQLHEQIRGLEAQIQGNQEQVDILTDEIGNLRWLLERGHTSRTRILALERERAERQGDVGQFTAEISRLQVAIGETELQLLQIDRDFQREVTAELERVQAELFDLHQRLTAADDVLFRRTVTAPEHGIIVNSQAHTIGGVVQPGATLMQLVPIYDELIVQARVDPADIDLVALGAEAEVRFSGLAMRNLPIILGEVIHVAADVTEDRQGMLYFEARVRVSEEQRGQLGDVVLLPGMPAEIVIKAGERTLVDYLIRPLEDAMFHGFRED
ncbi:MAG: HlyD family type I secretion periplasmic adaptor subunit [Geminicoccaceae bacterium]|nr:MAG: HlyD family type I secretion periplasmic adaptor subunit [Geminicoccaceae bacterium]